MGQRAPRSGGAVAIATTVSHPYTGALGEVVDLLIATEARHDQQGWGTLPPMMYRVSRYENGPLLQCDPTPLGINGRPARDDLQAIANAVSNDPFDAALMEVAYADPPLAHFMIIEGWMRTFQTITEAETATRGCPGGILPGSVQARWGCAVMGRYRVLLGHAQGQDPHLPDPHWTPLGMEASLQAIHLAVAKHWRDRGMSQ